MPNNQDSPCFWNMKDCTIQYGGWGCVNQAEWCTPQERCTKHWWYREREKITPWEALMTFVVKLLVTVEAIPQVSRCFTRQWRKDLTYNGRAPFQRTERSNGSQRAPPKAHIWLVSSLVTPEHHIHTLLFCPRHTQGTATGGLFGRAAASPPCRPSPALPHVGLP